MQINPQHAGWILHTTLVAMDGEVLDQQYYQYLSSISFLELLRDRQKTKKDWESNPYPVRYHLHICQILNYLSAGLQIKTCVTEEELEFHAKHEQALIDANSP